MRLEHGRIVIGETCIDASVEEGFLRLVQPLIADARRDVEAAIAADPSFASSFEPLPPPTDGTMIAEMCRAAGIAEVGPMAAVAGAVAGRVVEGLADAGCRHAVIDNGGDLCIMSERPVRVAVGIGVGLGAMLLEIPPTEMTGICSSSGTLGHSLSLGSSDVCTVISESPALADACATRLGNEVRSVDDLARATELVGRMDGVEGCLAVKDGSMASFGDVPFADGFFEARQASTCALLLGGPSDLSVIEEVHDGRRRIERLLESVVVPDVAESPFLRENRQPVVQRLPIAAVSASVDPVVQRYEMRMRPLDVVEDRSLVIPAQVQILQPYQVALILYPVYDRFRIGDPGKDRRYEAGRTDPCIVERLHRRQAALDADRAIHVAPEALVQSIDAESDSGIGERSDQIDVPQHQI